MNDFFVIAMALCIYDYYKYNIHKKCFKNRKNKNRKMENIKKYRFISA